MPIARGLIRHALPALALGAAMGCWLFGPPGMLLFGPGGGALAAILWLVARRAPRLATVAALLAAAAALHASSTLGWGAADAPDGTRYKVSPVGLSHVLTPHQPISRTIDCGWYGASRYEEPCAIAEGGTMPFAILRSVYPLVLSAALCCVIGAALSVTRRTRSAHYRSLAAGGAALTALTAVVLFAWSAGPALEPLRDLAVGTGGSLGTMQLTTAILLSVAAVSIPPHRLYVSLTVPDPLAAEPPR